MRRRKARRSGTKEPKAPWILPALVLLILTATIVLLAAIAVKLTSRGPIIYCQTRTGKDGKPYTIYKIRTMTHNCESKTGACWAAPSDPRITGIGRGCAAPMLTNCRNCGYCLWGDESGGTSARTAGVCRSP